MARTLKYIHHSEAGFIVWPADTELWHVHVKRAMLASPHLEGSIVSAGFVNMDVPEKPHCYGKSESLGIGMQEGDTAALRRAWGLEAAPVKA